MNKPKFGESKLGKVIDFPTVTPSTDKLLPCPFCGDKDPEIEDSGGDYPDVYVQCTDCQAQGPATRLGCRDPVEEGDDIDLEHEAVELWNRRANLQPEIQQVLHCSECGAQTSESVGAPEDSPLVFSCSKCGRVTCDNCGSGGLCSSCDVDNMLGDADE